MNYSEALTLGQARQEYFDRSGLGDGGYNDRWVKFKMGPIPFAIPNTEARKKAVKLHDLHHVLTGYVTTWTGEAEISGWEIASGCRSYLVAWVINFFAFIIGLVIAPGAVYRAFLRGRHCGNLYGVVFGESLLEKTVGETRHELRLDQVGTPVFTDKLLFALWAAAPVMLAGGLIYALLLLR